MVKNKKRAIRKPTEKQKAKVQKLFAKVETKEDLNKINTSKLSAAEKNYFNKVKAGKARYLSAFRLSTGQYSQLSEQFIKKTVLPLYRTQGGKVKMKSGNNPDISDSGLQQFIKENRAAFEEAQKTIVQPYFYNPVTIEKPLNNFTGDRIFINDRNGLIQVTRAEALEYIQRQQQNVINLGGITYTFVAEFRNGFTELVLKVPELSGVSDLDEAIEDFDSLGGTVIVSEKKK